MEKIVFATGNKGKIASAKMYFEKAKIDLECQSFTAKEPELNDLEFIAETKVRQVYELIKKPCFTVDAGFYIEAYPGDPNFPGAFANRAALDVIGIDGILKKMEGIKNRKCYTRECLAYYDGQKLRIFWGRNDGTLALEPLGDNEGLWSDFWKIFIPQNCNKTLAQMDPFERFYRRDNHTECFEEFLKWYKSINK